MRISLLSIIIIFIALFGCSSEISKPTPEPAEERQAEKISVEETSEIISEKKIKDEHNGVLPGIDVLSKSNFEILKGKNVGLITNQTGINKDLKSTIDILDESDAVNLVALFGPEHGVRGDVEGGKYINFYQDSKTNLPVYSLYGKTRKPNKSMLTGLDVLVYDIQDIGVRSYTFISTMGLAMEAASENNLEFIVLDRPNPLGGEKIEGNLIDDGFRSFISQFDIPYVYGLTCGELAKLLVGEKMIDVADDFKPVIIEMENWARKMAWEDTGLHWIPTSPHIPHPISAIHYPMTGILGELRSSISIGVGYTLPFQIIGAEWINSQELIDELETYNIPGIFFRPMTFQPYYAFGEGETLNGIQLHILDYSLVNLTKTQFYIIDALKKLYPEKDLFELSGKGEIGMFNKAVGSDTVYKLISDSKPLDQVFKFLDKDISSFKRISAKYMIY